MVCIIKTILLTYGFPVKQFFFLNLKVIFALLYFRTDSRQALYLLRSELYICKMNRPRQRTKRRRKLEFLDEILDLAEKNGDVDVFAHGEIPQNVKNYNYYESVDRKEQPKSDLGASVVDSHIGKFSEGDIAINANTVEDAGSEHRKNVQIFLNMFGLASFTSLRVSGNKGGSPTADTRTVDSEIKTTKDIMADFDDLEIIEIDVGGNSGESLVTSACPPNSRFHDIKGHDIDIELRSEDIKRHEIYNSLMEISHHEVGEEESMEIDDVETGDNVIAHDNVESDNIEDYNDHTTDDDSDDDSDDSDGSDNANDDSDDTSDEDDENDLDMSSLRGKFDAVRADETNLEDGGDLENGENDDYDNIPANKHYGGKTRHSGIEERIRREIEEIERKMTLLKQKKHRKRKRYTKCKHSGNLPESHPKINIKPIKRSKRLAEPIRLAVLKRHTLRNAWAGCRWSCCGKDCWSRWKWVNMKRVLSDYW